MKILNPTKLLVLKSIFYLGLNKYSVFFPN